MEMEDFFGEGGILAEHLESFTPRQGQLDLAKAVMEAIRKKKHLIAEAPTGTGKSMAYGIPAAVWTMETAGTAVIATANITLQEQLVGKDLPTIRRIIKECIPEEHAIADFDFALLKGMSNYLCLLGLEEAEDEHGSDDWFNEILRWSKKTSTGDRSELAIEYPAQLWSKVSTTADDCLRKSCKHYEDCFVFKRKQTLGSAHIIVTNYHMLFTDVLVQQMTDGNAGLLPPYDLLIMDEAHEVADIAMDFQGFQLSAGKLKWAARTLAKIPNSDEADRALKRVHSAVDAFFDKLERRKKQRIIEKPLGDDAGVCSALTAAADVMVRFAKQNINEEASDKAAALKSRLIMSSGLCRRRAREIEEICYGVRPTSDIKAELDEKKGDQMPLFPEEHKKEIEALEGELKQGPKFPDGYVYFLEEGGKGKLELCAKVVTPQEFLQVNIFDEKTVIMTSATIATDGGFEFVANEVGLSDGEYDSLVVPSPFDPERVLAVIPSPPFPAPDTQDFAKEVANTIITVCQQTAGGVMGLFTSYKNLNQVRELVGPALGLRKLYVQGEMPKGRIIEHFKKDFEDGHRALILATASFWQGVDIPGQALSVVVIDKIPFARPDDPVMHYLERIEENAFFDYSVPKAIIALKQGVGRLIRRESDFGCVVILDTRLRTKNYKKTVLSALPAGCFISDNLDHVASFIADHS